MVGDGESIKQKLDVQLKSALLAGEKQRVLALRSLKSAIMYAEVEKGQRESGLSDDDVLKLFRKEAKKRQESADLFAKGGNHEKAQAELAEKTLIESFLPPEMSDESLYKIVEEIFTAKPELAKSGQIGQAIGAVKRQVGTDVDGARIAKVVQERLKK